MLEIGQEDIEDRISRDNPWWQKGSQYQLSIDNMPFRDYFDTFYSISTNFNIKRATVLMGPRRVGKTVMLYQLIKKALQSGIGQNQIMYVSIDTPVYTGLGLEKFVNILTQRSLFSEDKPSLVIFDEVQYLKGWERHLKDLVDSYPNIKFVVSGSAAAALRLRSRESGAGRFTDFQLPPLTFAEFIRFVGEYDKLISKNIIKISGNIEYEDFEAVNINELNDKFIQYLNYGGYPEAVFNEDIRSNADQFVRNDIIDKVLLKDLPVLYGITNVQELNAIFTHIAFNTGHEIALDALSSRSGLSKPSIRKYIEYLESAFLIKRIAKVNEKGKPFLRESAFKAYLTNPSMRAALFAPVESSNHRLIGHLAEAAMFSQWAHYPSNTALYYSRWRDRRNDTDMEVDMIFAQGPEMRPAWADEIKWSNKPFNNPRSELKGIINFAKRNENSISNIQCTTKTIRGFKTIDGVDIIFEPTSLCCFQIGHDAVKQSIKDRLLKSQARYPHAVLHSVPNINTNLP